jgi:hypothetical protein
VIFPVATALLDQLIAKAVVRQAFSSVDVAALRVTHAEGLTETAAAGAQLSNRLVVAGKLHS